ncbi:MAG: hypothetical protein AAFS10_28215, partial [Myxococcota bacterium]
MHFNQRWHLWLCLFGCMAAALVSLHGCGGDDATDAPAESADVGGGDGDMTTTEDSDGMTDAESTGPNLEGELPYETLSAYAFFTGPMVELRPNVGVIPYTVAAPLWSDHAEKGRFVVLPPGTQVVATENDGWQWPLGTIFIKTFFFSIDRRQPDGAARIIETRLLRLEEQGWTSTIYVWNAEQTEATLTKLGERVNLSVIDAHGEEAEQLYLVPNTEECKSCHEVDDQIQTLGVTTPQLNRTVELEDGRSVNQLAWWVEQGWLSGLPEEAERMALARPFDESYPLEARARAYLHGNCGHCHREGGGGGRSGLRLVWWETRDARLGICKNPVAAGAGS